MCPILQQPKGGAPDRHWLPKEVLVCLHPKVPLAQHLEVSQVLDVVGLEVLRFES
jgi:hypothetical protein